MIAPLQDVGARLGALLEHDDRDLLAVFGRQLPQADGGGQPGRPATDDDHVVLHRFARTVLLEQCLRCHVFLWFDGGNSRRL